MNAVHNDRLKYATRQAINLFVQISRQFKIGKDIQIEFLLPTLFPNIEIAHIANL
jgi:hypothetical protein